MSFIELEKNRDSDGNKVDRMKVYIAGPYKGGGTWGENLNKAITAAEKVFNLGHIPFVPHTHTALWDLLYPKGSSEWLYLDFEWINECDCLVRLDGESEGADKEVRHAQMIGIDVYYGIDSFLDNHE